MSGWDQRQEGAAAVAVEHALLCPLILLAMLAVSSLWVYARQNLGNHNCNLLYEHFELKNAEVAGFKPHGNGLWKYDDPQGFAVGPRSQAYGKMLVLENGAPLKRSESWRQFKLEPGSAVFFDTPKSLIMRTSDKLAPNQGASRYELCLPRHGMQFLVSKWSLTLFFLGVCLALTWRRSYFRQSALSRLVSHPLVSLFLLMASFLVCDCLLCIRPLSYSNGDDIGYMGLDFPAAWDSIKYSKRPQLMIWSFKAMHLLSPFGQLVPYVLLISAYAAVFLFAVALRYCQFPIAAYFVVAAEASNHLLFNISQLGWSFNGYFSETPGFTMLMVVAAMVMCYARAVHRGSRRQCLLLVILTVAVAAGYHFRITHLILVAWVPATVVGLLFLWGLPRLDWRRLLRQFCLVLTCCALPLAAYCGFRFLCCGEFSLVKSNSYNSNSEVLLFITKEDIPALPMDMREPATKVLKKVESFPPTGLRPWLGKRKNQPAFYRKKIVMFTHGLFPKYSVQWANFIKALKQRHRDDILHYRWFMLTSMCDLPYDDPMWGYGVVSIYDPYDFGYGDLRHAYLSLALYVGLCLPATALALLLLLGKLKWTPTARRMSRQAAGIAFLCLGYTAISLALFFVAGSRPLARYIWFVYIMAPVLVWCLSGLLWAFAATCVLRRLKAGGGFGSWAFRVSLALLLTLTLVALAQYAYTRSYSFSTTLWHASVTAMELAALYRLSLFLWTRFRSRRRLAAAPENHAS